MAKTTVADEPGATSETDSGDQSSWLAGFISSTPDSANSPKRPSNQAYYAPGSYATAMKAAWKNKPGFLPNGEGDDGSF